MRAIRSLVLASAALLASGSAQALSITATDVTITSGDVGQTFSISYNGFVNTSTIVSGLTASALYTVQSVSSTSITLSVDMTNTTSSPLTSRVSVFGFDTDPSITGATASGAFNVTVQNSALPSGFGAIELCVKNGQANGCQGGGGTGIAQGTTGTTTLTLNFASIGASGVTLSNFGVRYQSITGAGNVNSAVGRGTPGTPPVPEPAAMALFGVGALIVGAKLRKRARS
jgi:hypothetical protein